MENPGGTARFFGLRAESGLITIKRGIVIPPFPCASCRPSWVDNGVIYTRPSSISGFHTGLME